MEKRFVTLGLKKKGRIVKAEEYELHDLQNLLQNRNRGGRVYYLVAPRFFQRMIRRKVDVFVDVAYNRGIHEGIEIAFDAMNELIDEDTPGRKAKKKK